MRDQEIIGLQEAYASIYTQTDVVSEDAQQAVGKALDAAAKNPVIKAIGRVIAPVGKGRETPTATSGGYRPVKEEIDTFDIILEYLVAEGYADTNKAALVIMANMSEEWRQSIVEAQEARNNPEKYEDEQDKKKSKKQRAMDDPHTGINSPAFAAFMKKQGR